MSGVCRETRREDGDVSRDPVCSERDERARDRVRSLKRKRRREITATRRRDECTSITVMIHRNYYRSLSRPDRSTAPPRVRVRQSASQSSPAEVEYGRSAPHITHAAGARTPEGQTVDRGHRCTHTRAGPRECGTPHPASAVGPLRDPTMYLLATNRSQHTSRRSTSSRVGSSSSSPAAMATSSPTAPP